MCDGARGMARACGLDGVGLMTQGGLETAGASLRDGMGAGLMVQVGEGVCKCRLETVVLRWHGQGCRLRRARDSMGILEGRHGRP